MYAFEIEANEETFETQEDFAKDHQITTDQAKLRVSEAFDRYQNSPQSFTQFDKNYKEKLQNIIQNTQ